MTISEFGTPHATPHRPYRSGAEEEIDPNTLADRLVSATPLYFGASNVSLLDRNALSIISVLVICACWFSSLFSFLFFS